MAKKKQEIKIVSVESNERVDKIVADYPASLIAHPRPSFEDQLRKHLLKHKVK